METSNKTPTFKELREIDLGKYIEKKGTLSYLSWAWAVDFLMQNDPMATWEFKEPKYFGDTVMVFCEVSAFGKIIRMHLPVMDNRNDAIANPCARDISDTMMRCLVKAIACFGIGLYIYAGDGIPSSDQNKDSNEAAKKPPIQPKGKDPRFETGRPPKSSWDSFSAPTSSINQTQHEIQDPPVETLAVQGPETVAKLRKALVNASKESGWTTDDVAAEIKFRFEVKGLDALTAEQYQELFDHIKSTKRAAPAVIIPQK